VTPPYPQEVLAAVDDLRAAWDRFHVSSTDYGRAIAQRATVRVTGPLADAKGAAWSAVMGAQTKLNHTVRRWSEQGRTGG